MMHWLRHICIALVAAAMPVAAFGEDYPSKPIRLVVVTAAGGLMDVAARVTAEHLGKALGQRVVVENRGGSGGNLGAEVVAKAEPDGHPRNGRESRWADRKGIIRRAAVYWVARLKRAMTARSWRHLARDSLGISRNRIVARGGKRQ
jgi:hypothetical protein